MKSILILTKTNWNEPPRIRHQITRLFREKGYKVIFLEKNNYRSLFIKRREEDGITFFSHSELIHHQLRFSPFIQKLNNWVVKQYLKKIAKKIEFDFILNFNYDYSFLKETFPNKKLVTFINDDFEAQAKFWMIKQIKNQVRKTCENSDYVLTVSYPLEEKLRTYKDNVTLFLPWSKENYKTPERSIKRNTVLYFGFVGRLDWEAIESMVKTTTYYFRFVGPTTKDSDAKMIDRLRVLYKSNFEYITYSTFDDLRLDDVFCSILPYNSNLHSVQACTVSNRAFNLLSVGIPLVYADLRYLIEAPNTVIRKNKNVEEYKDSLEYYHNNFYSVQRDIQIFLEDHYKENRWKIFEKTIHE